MFKITPPTFVGSTTSQQGRAGLVPVPPAGSNNSYLQGDGTWGTGLPLDVKLSVRVATTANITLSGAQTIDGVSAVAGNRVLVKDQTLGANNGIYVVAAGTWARSIDANTSAGVTSGMFTFVSEGTVGGGNGYVLTTADPIVLGTTVLVFTQFSGAGEIIAGTNIQKSGNTISTTAALTSISGVSSAALSTLTLGTGTFGTALTFTSATGAAAFAAPVSITGALSATAKSIFGGTAINSSPDLGEKINVLGYGVFSSVTPYVNYYDTAGSSGNHWGRTGWNNGIYTIESVNDAYTVPTTIASFGSAGLTLAKNLTFGTAGSILSGTTGSQGITLTGTNQSFTITPSGTGFLVDAQASISNYLGAFVSAPTYGALFVGLGVAPSATNYVLAANGAETILNSATAGGGIKFKLNDAEKARFAPTTGNLLLGGLTTDGAGVLQFPAATTSAGGIAFGTDTFMYRGAAGLLIISATTDPSYRLVENGTTMAQIDATGSVLYVSSSNTGGSLQLRTNGSTAALTLDSSQNATFAGAIFTSTDTLSGAGAVSVTKATTLYTSTGGAQALTLANGTNGQIKRIIHVVDGGSGVLTPTTKTGYTTITFTNAGDAVTLQFVTTQGWCIVGIFGAVAA